MNNKWIYNFGDEETWYSSEEFNTKEEAISGAIKYAKEEYEPTGCITFYVGQTEDYILKLGTESLIEQILDNAYGTIGSVAEDWLDYKELEKNGSLAILDERLNRVFDEWMTETNNQPNFYEVVNIEEITLDI
jgi:hypothetical protein